MIVDRRNMRDKITSLLSKLNHMNIQLEEPEAVIELPPGE
jgi:hypothetical protein